MRRTGWKRPLLVVALALLGGCLGSPMVLDVAAQRAEQQAITADWLRYVDADPALTAPQRQSRHDTAAAQDLRIRKLEESIAGTAPGVPK